MGQPVFGSVGKVPEHVDVMFVKSPLKVSNSHIVKRIKIAFNILIIAAGIFKVRASAVARTDVKV